MAALPENWEWDYDGTRWLYRFKPTGLIQYTFPKPGDEFPEFVDDSSAPDLAPEERLVSQQQIKRRSTLSESSSKQSIAAKRRERAASNVIADPDEGGSPFWLQPDGLMYMGPGAYNDISPLQEEEEQQGREDNTTDENKGTADVTTPAPAPAPAPATDPAAAKDVASTGTATASTETDPHQGAPRPTRSQISPVTSTETTPLVANTLPATATPELDGAVVIQATGNIVVDAEAVPSPDVPLLDSRQVPYNPIGVIAELPSELTGQCGEEINPAPVELPGNDMMLDVTSKPVVYANAFPLAPAELPSDEIPAGRRTTGNAAEQKVLGSENPAQEQVQEQQRKAYQAVQELLNRPYRPARHNSMPQPGGTVTQPPNSSADSAPGKFQPYNPARRAVLGAAAKNRYSMPEPPVPDQTGGNKRHSLAGPSPSQLRPVDVAPALQPPHAARPLNSTGNGPQTMILGPGAVGENVPAATTKENEGGLTHVPSVLQPARGRPVIRAKSPPQSQGASPARTYQTYKPIRDLQRDIEDTVQLLSNAGLGHGTTILSEASNPERPKASRSSTLPADLPVLPYMGARPQLPQSSASAPVTLRGLQSHQTPIDASRLAITSGWEANTTIIRDYSVSLPSSSPDLPQPLNLSRKSPPHQSSVPIATSLMTPIAAEPDMISMKATPVSSIATIATTPVVGKSSPESNPTYESPGPLSAAESRTARSVSGNQPELPAILNTGSFEAVSTRPSDQIIAPGEQPQPVDHRPPGQAVSSGFSVVPEPYIPAAPQVAPPAQPSTFKLATATQSGFAVDVPDAPGLLQSTTGPSPATESSPLSGENTTSELSQIKVQVAVSNRQPGTLTSEAVLQGIGQSGSTRYTDAQMSHVVPVPHAIHQAHNRFPLQSGASLPIDHIASSQPGNLSYTSPTPPPAAEHPNAQSSFDGNERNVQQAATTPPTSVIPRTPSPVSSGSSPPTRKADVLPKFSPALAPAVTNTAPPQNLPAAGQLSSNQDGIHAPPAGFGASPIASSSPASNGVLTAASTAPTSTPPTSHHPLTSHPANVSQFRAEGGSASQRPPHTVSAQTTSISPPRPPLPAQNNAETNPPMGISSQQPRAVRVPTSSQPPSQNIGTGSSPSMPVPPPLLISQGQASSQTSTVNQDQMASPPPVPQKIPIAGQGQAPTRQTAPGAKAQSQPSSMSNVSTQVHQNVPLRKLSQPVVSPSGKPLGPGAPVAAPPQMAMVFPPPAMHPGMQVQGIQPGMLPQQHYPFQPGVPHPAGMQPQPMLPFMMQPSPMHTGAHVMQPAQPPQPVTEGKSWFGRLWGGDGVKKANNPSGSAPSPSPSPSNKLQKGTRPQASLVYLPPLHPNQPAPAPQFAASSAQMQPPPPHMMMMAHTGQQGQPPQGMQLQQQPLPQFQQQQPPQFQQQQPPQFQQQQQQRLPWMTTGNGANNAAQVNVNPQFRAPTSHDNNNATPNRSVLPPPAVRQAIQQQEQRLAQTRGSGMGWGQGAQPPPLQVRGGQGAAQGQGQGQGQAVHSSENSQGPRGEPVKGEGKPVVAEAVTVAPFPAAAPGPAPTPAPVSAAAPAGNTGSDRWGSRTVSGYDGSGWGDDDDGEYR